MAFESVQIQTTRNGSSLVVGYREDLVAADVIAASLTSTVGITSVLWELVGRPEYSGAGGAGPEPLTLATAPTCSFTVDSDSGAVHLDGTYLLRATINPGSPGQVRKTVDLVRLSSLTIPGMSGVRHLRKLACFESLEDTSVPTILQGWATQANRWFDLVKTIALGGGVIETLSGAYGAGLGSADQTLNLNDANGGGVVINGAAGGFTGASALRVNTAAGGPLVIDRATGNLGVGIAAPLEEIHVRSASPGLRLDRTGGAAISLENITDVLNLINRTGPVTIATFPGTGGMRTDFGVGIGAAAPTAAALAMGIGSTAPVSASNTGRFRYNEVTQQFEVSQNGGAYAPLGAGAASVLETDGIATGAVQLSALSFPTSGAVYAHVKSVHDMFYLDRTSTATADGITVVTALGGTGRWVRMMFADPALYQVMNWYIDPAGTFSPAGNDEAVGDATHPLRSVPELRRRIRGAVYPITGPTLHVLSSSTNVNDGIFDGFTTGLTSLSAFFHVLGSPVPTGVTGIIGSYVPYSGNTRGQFTDSSIPVSWTASGAISSPTGSRWIRKVGTGLRHYAPLLKDLGSKTVQFGHVVDWDETDPTVPRATETNFANGDAYEVVSFPQWPALQNGSGSILFQCLDIGGGLNHSNSLSTYYQLCGFPQNLGSYFGAGQTAIYSAVFCMQSPAGFGLSSPALYVQNSSFVNAVVEYSYFAFPLSTTSLIFVNSPVQLFHSPNIGSLGNMRFFDCTGPLISLRHNASARAVGAIVGSGNSGPLVNCDTAGIFYGADLITATTSAGLPFTVNGTGYATPIVDEGSGDAIYNSVANSPVRHVNLANAVNNQDALPLGQANTLIAAAVAGGVGGFTPGSVAFAGAGGTLTQDNANFFWDRTNRRVGIGTNAPLFDVVISRSANAQVVVQVLNVNAGNTAVSEFSAQNGAAGTTYGVTGTGFVGGGSTPNLGSSTAFLNSGTSLYLGATGVITLQTGATQAERLRILATGEVQLSSLSTGGMVKAAAGGQLGLGVAGTDFAVPVTVTAGAGLTGGGTTAAPFTIDVAATDGSITVAANSIGVGVLQNDGQHGSLGGGSDHAVATHSVAGFMSAADKTTLDGLVSGGVPGSRLLIAGAGLTGGGDLTADRTFDVVANADGSILVHPNDVQVGVLATDAQHGNRGGGAIHAVATTSVAGFMSAADKTTFQNATFLTQSTTNAPPAAFSLGSLASGVLQHVVTGIISAPTSLAVVGGQIPFGNASGSGLLNQDANLFWDNTTKRVGLGTQIPSAVLTIDHSGTNDANTLVVLNSNAGAAANASVVVSNLTAAGTLLMNGTGHSGGGTTPNLGTNTLAITTSIPGPTPTLYLGSHGVITLQTGATQAERLRISAAGTVSIAALAAGGVVKSALTTGLLSNGLVNLGEIEPIGPAKLIGFDGPGAGAPFDISVIAPLKMPAGSGQLVFDTGFTIGSVVFQGASQIAEDHTNLFWDNTNKRLGIGTNTPAVGLDVVRSVASQFGVSVINTSTAAAAVRAVYLLNNGLSAASLGLTGQAFTGLSGLPNLAADTTFLLGDNDLYVGTFRDITFQTGITPAQAERLRILSTGETVVFGKLSGGTASGRELVLQGTTHATLRGHVQSLDPFGVGRSAGVLGGAPQFAVAGNVSVPSSAGATLDYFVVNTSTVNITGGTNIVTAGGFNWVTIQPPVYSGSVVIGAGGFQAPAATLCIEGPPTVAGGASFNNGASLGPLALWAKGSVNIDGSLNLNNNLNMNGSLNVATDGTFLGNLTVGGIVFIGSAQVTAQLDVIGQLRLNLGSTDGGGSPVTPGHTGGAGPTSTAMAHWIKVNFSGTDCFIPSYI